MKRKTKNEIFREIPSRNCFPERPYTYKSYTYTIHVLFNVLTVFIQVSLIALAYVHVL